MNELHLHLQEGGGNCSRLETTLLEGWELEKTCNKVYGLKYVICFKTTTHSIQYTKQKEQHQL